VTAVRLAAQTNVLTDHNDPARTGRYLAETILTPANVNSTAFGKLLLAPLDDLVDAQRCGGLRVARSLTASPAQARPASAAPRPTHFPSCV
jgi:hypothetical protein